MDALGRLKVVAEEDEEAEVWGDTVAGVACSGVEVVDDDVIVVVLEEATLAGSRAEDDPILMFNELMPAEREGVEMNED